MSHNFFMNALYDIYPDWKGSINIDGDNIEIKTTAGSEVDIAKVKAHLQTIKPRYDSLAELEELDKKVPRYAEASILSIAGTEFEDTYLLEITKRKIELREKI